MSHREDIRLLLEKHEELVCDRQKALEIITKPVVPAAPGEATTVDDDNDANPAMKPSILGMLNED
jgi:hypothetical protein